MSRIEALALRCLMPGFIGTTVPEWVSRHVARGLGGVVLFARNIETREQVARLTASLHQERSELLIAIDEEGGDVTRLEAKTGSSYPGNLALGTANDSTLTEEVAAAIGAELAAAGIDLDFAPDADINSNPLNPVIGVRSFGTDAALVAAHTAAWITGLQSAGLAACAKHFPGHGDTAVDSHLSLPVVSEDPHLRALEPFKAAIAAGVKAVMSAHIVVPSLDDAPATISHRIMTGLLRDELGFEGLAVSDGLEMRALTNARSLAENAVLALAAGCDALCIGGGLAGEDTVNDVVRKIVQATSDGRLTEARLEQAAGRVDALAASRAALQVEHRDFRDVGIVAARRAIRAEGQVRVGDQVIVARIGGSDSMASGKMPWGMTAALAERGVKVEAVEIDGVPADIEAIANHADGKSLVIAARGLHANTSEAATVDSLLAKRPDAVIVDMGWPSWRPPRAKGYIATHGSARVCAVAAAEALRP